MKWQSLIKVALISLLRNPLRSLLTMLGMIIGVGSVIALVALGEGSQKDIQGQITSLGTNLLIVLPGSSQMGGVRGGSGSLDTLTMADVETLRKNGRLFQGVSPEIRVQAQIIAGASNWNSMVIGGGAGVPGHSQLSDRLRELFRRTRDKKPRQGGGHRPDRRP